MNYRTPDPSEIITRLKTHLDVESDAKLAEILGIPPSTLANWRRRRSLPYAVCVRIAQERGISLDWLILGKKGLVLDTSALALAAYTLGLHSRCWNWERLRLMFWARRSANGMANTWAASTERSQQAVPGSKQQGSCTTPYRLLLSLVPSPRQLNSSHSAARQVYQNPSTRHPMTRRGRTNESS